MCAYLDRGTRRVFEIRVDCLLRIKIVGLLYKSLHLVHAPRESAGTQADLQEVDCLFAAGAGEADKVCDRIFIWFGTHS